MKWILRLLILLLVAAVALGAYSFVLPATCIVEQSIVLHAPPERILTYLNNPTQWEHWSMWSKEKDPAIVHMYGGPLSGEGARHSWISDKYGSGKRIFTTALQPNAVAYEQLLTGDTDTIQGEFILEKTTEGTRLVWKQVSPVEDSMLGRYKGAWRRHHLEKELEYGLTNLQTLLQQTEKKSVKK